MMREIIRARMEAVGAAVAEIVCKMSRPGHAGTQPPSMPRPCPPRPRPIRARCARR